MVMTVNRPVEAQEQAVRGLPTWYFALAACYIVLVGPKVQAWLLNRAGRA